MKDILLVEDNLADVALMHRVFRKYAAEFNVVAVNSVTAARSMLERDNPDLLIADFMLPDGEGTELIPVGLARGFPTIVLTGRGSENVAVQTLQNGALDYVVKSQEQLEDLPHLATRALCQWENMTERERNRRLLAESEERFRMFAELAADWFWETDCAMRITFISDRFRCLSRLPINNFIGMPLRNIFSVDEDDFDCKQAEQLWDQQKEFELEVPFLTENQKTRTLYLRGKPFFDSQDRFCGYRGIGRDITTQREALEEITYMAMHDPLTDVLNRRSLEFELKSALLRVSHYGEKHAFCFFDLDAFKQINDSAGHLFGDKILKELVATISRTVRSGDILGRLGGDEFGVLLKNCTVAKALDIAKAIVEAIADQKFAHAGNNCVQVTTSVGIVALRENHDITQVYRDADDACYQAKRAGGNQVRTASVKAAAECYSAA